MAANTLTFLCLINGEPMNSFSVRVKPTATVNELKDAIKLKNKYDRVPAHKLILWRATIPARVNVVNLKYLNDKMRLNNPRMSLSELFPERPDNNTYIVINLPEKFREDDMAPPAKRARLVIDKDTLRVAIEKAGLEERAVVDGKVFLSRLDDKDRVSVLRFLGSSVDGDSPFVSIKNTALAMRNSPFQETEILSTPQQPTDPAVRDLFPVVYTEDLYVRQAYKDLYTEIIQKFQDSSRNRARKHVVVTGMSGIGNSAFLVYLTIRLLATACDDNPPIVVFQERGGSTCYVYGGPSVLRYGDIEDFRTFLNLAETWYLVDSSPNPLLGRARTIISASLKTLNSELNQYQEVDKRVPWRYFMAPWTQEELERCRNIVKGFKVVSKALLKDLYTEIGGVPRYVLERPRDVLNLGLSDTAGAKRSACAHVLQAISYVQSPMRMMQCFEPGMESLEHSNRLLHCWPTDDHQDFRLEWASDYVLNKVIDTLNDVAWQQILEKLVGFNVGVAKRPMFELYARHIFRKGGSKFLIKDLHNKTSTTFDLPAKPSLVSFQEIVPAVPPGTLCVPNSCCVDLLLSSKHLLHVSVSKRHEINGPLFSRMLSSLLDGGWIQSSEETCLVFVVPGDVYDDFQEQEYVHAAGTVYKRVPKLLRSVRQFALKIDLKSASTGEPPGIQGPAF